MTSIKSKLAFYILNKHQGRLAGMDLETARQHFDKLARIPFKPRIKDITEKTVEDVRVRIYFFKRDTPIVVYFHGGGFTLGSLSSHDVVARVLYKATKCTVLSVDYRLAPEHQYPAAVEDGLAVLSWLRRNGTLNQSVILAGDSAGGHIALDVALKSTPLLGNKLKGLILMYPALDPSLSSESMQKYAVGHFVTKQNMLDFWDAYDSKTEIRWPLSEQELKKLSPTLVLTADKDILRDEACNFSNQLEAVGVATECHTYKNAPHGFMQMPASTGWRVKAAADIRRFVDKL